jgi:hypothetical protein
MDHCTVGVLCLTRSCTSHMFREVMKKGRGWRRTLINADPCSPVAAKMRRVRSPFEVAVLEEAMFGSVGWFQMKLMFSRSSSFSFIRAIVDNHSSSIRASRSAYASGLRRRSSDSRTNSAVGADKSVVHRFLTVRRTVLSAVGADRRIIHRLTPVW